MSEFLGLSYVNPVAVESVDQTDITESLSLKKQVLRRPGQYWRLSLTLSPEYNNSGGGFARLAAHKAEQGKSGEFDIAVPQPPGGDVYDAMDTVIQHIAGTDNAVRIPVANSVFLIGRFVTFGTDRKVYQIKSSATVSATSTDIQLTPPVQYADLPAGVLLGDVQMRVRYSNAGGFSVTLGRGGVMTERVVVEEVI